MYFTCLKKLLLGTGLLIISANALANMGLDTFNIKGANDELLSRHYLYFEDKTCGQKTTDIINCFLQDQFLKHNDGKPVFNSRYTNSCYWFILPLKNDTTITLSLLWSFYNNDLGFVLYDATDMEHPLFVDSVVSYQNLGQRKFPTRAPAFKIVLKPQDFELLLLKVYKLNTNGVYFISDLSTTEDILLWETGFMLLVGRYVGYFIFICLFNIFLWLLLKAKIHLWHGIYVAVIIWFSSKEYMFDILYLPDWVYPYFSRIPIMLVLLLALFFGLIVLQIFTRQKTSFKRFNFLNYLKAVILSNCSLLFIASLLLPYQSAILSFLRISTDVLFFVGLFVWLFYIIWGSIKRNKTFLAYFVASFCMILSYIEYILTLALGKPLFYFPPGNILVGLAIETTLLTLFFAIKISNERKNSYKQLKQKNIENNEMAKALITIQEDERNRIANDLHDGLGATLGALKLLISNSNASNKDQLVSIVNNAATETRSIAHNLLPASILENGLNESLHKFQELLSRQTKTVFNFVFIGDDNAISSNVAVHLFRIINEAVSNIIKHAIASEANIQVIVDEGVVQLIIEDDGVGLRSNGEMPGMGLKSITTRVTYLNGNIHFDSSEKGTTIIIEVPIKNQQADERKY